MKEIWKKIIIKRAEYPYEISSFGRIRRLLPSNGTTVGLIRKDSLDRDGYVSFNLSMNSKKKTIKVHQLVLSTFSSIPRRGRYVNHKNRNRTDNRISNLEWLTPRQNVHHCFGLGKWKCSMG